MVSASKSQDSSEGSSEVHARHRGPNGTRGKAPRSAAQSLVATTFQVSSAAGHISSIESVGAVRAEHCSASYSEKHLSIHGDTTSSRVKDFTTLTLELALPIAEGIPVAGGPMKAVIGVLLKILTGINVGLVAL